MSTPYSKILNSFHSKFQSPYKLDPDLEKEFFITALGDFELELYSLNYKSDTELFESDLLQAEINILGSLMYKAYLHRERDRAMKLNNIIGRDIKLTGMSDTKQALNKAYLEMEDEIDKQMNKLKTSSFE